MEIVQKISLESIYVLTAVSGGMARYLYKYTRGRKFSFQEMLAELFISGFSGIMFYKFAEIVLNFPDSANGLLAGLGGWMGVESMKFLADYFKNKSKTVN